MNKYTVPNINVKILIMNICLTIDNFNFNSNDCLHLVNPNEMRDSL